jgi:hypothetical protein
MKAEAITISPEDFNSNRPLVMKLLKQYGVIRVPGYYGGEDLQGLNAEFNRLLECKEPYLKRMDYSVGKGSSVAGSALDKTDYPYTWKTYHAPFMNEIVSEYFERTDVNPVLGIYFVLDVVGSAHHAQNLHFDVERSLKYFIYLTDTSTQNGAFVCAPGSKTVSDSIRKKYVGKINYDNRELSRDLPFTEEEMVAVEGSAGTLIVFDTDVFHKTGNVVSGERRVMRSFSTIVSVPMVKSEAPKKSFLQRIFGK